MAREELITALSKAINTLEADVAAGTKPANYRITYHVADGCFRPLSHADLAWLKNVLAEKRINVGCRYRPEFQATAFILEKYRNRYEGLVLPKDRELELERFCILAEVPCIFVNGPTELGFVQKLLSEQNKLFTCYCYGGERYCVTII